MNNQWSQEDQDKLLDAVCCGVTVKHIVEMVLEQTSHSEDDIRLRLEAMGVIDQEADIDYLD